MPSRVRRRTQNELRCFCARNPLLATFGLDEEGKLYIHVKVYKQQRVYGEVLITEGTVRLHCRECFRWHKVVMQPHGKAELQEMTDGIPLPEEVSRRP